MALRRLYRTTAFKLATIYLVIFTLFAGGLIYYLASSTHSLLRTQLQLRLNDEVGELDSIYQRGGLRRLVRAIEWRSRRPDSSLYLITDPQGQPIAGNILDVPPDIFQEEGWVKDPITYTRFEQANGSGFDPDEQLVHRAVAQIYFMPNGLRLLVGRDIGEGERFRDIFKRAFNLSVVLMVLLGLLTWLFVSRRVLRRVDDVGKASKRIMAGHLDERLPIRGSHDEFDRLSVSLNTMLDRIETLMAGLKEVSDNIAHDLKTPLTRMRNRVEIALRGEGGEQELREALSTTLEESENLIRIFDALLRIARLEAGSATGDLKPVDLAGIARDVSELYEPVAEEDGIGFVISASEPAFVTGSRELLGQVIANLLDNALKYAREPGKEGLTPEITLSVESRDKSVVLCVTDNGPGIPEADRDRVLQRFVRLEESRSQPGSGLGLSLVAAVARLLDGKVQLGDNKPGLSVELQLTQVETIGSTPGE
ncbi:sensor histidine kinase [Coralliovum pocilloporae]|uniref:sensor histidine kinase n=1 Tax=Coralliovum pocilloporae TaxID=3066369 RepID=UPI0033079D15